MISNNRVILQLKGFSPRKESQFKEVINLDLREGEVLAVYADQPNPMTDFFLKSFSGQAQDQQKGEIVVLGKELMGNLDWINQKLAVSLGSTGLDQELSIFENTSLQCLAKNIDTDEINFDAELVLKLGLDGKLHQPIKTLKFNQSQKAALLIAVTVSKELLLLLNPTLNCDDETRYLIWDLLRALKKQGKSSIVVTHNAYEVEKIADQVLILNENSPMIAGPIHKVIKDFIGSEVVEFQTLTLELPYYHKKLKERGFECFYQGYKGYIFLKEGQSLRGVLEVVSGERMTLRRGTVRDLSVKNFLHRN